MDSSLQCAGRKTVWPGLVRLVRPRQWIKNGFVLLPLLFTGEFTRIDSLFQVLLAAGLFCVASSVTYIINDYRDEAMDRLHPVKRLTRPLAAGEVTRSQALILLAVLAVILAFGLFSQLKVGVVILAYLVINLAYTFVLKHQPVIDIFTIALGFVLRVYAGAVALAVPVSSWMFVTSLCLALYLAAVKRRQELLQRGSDGRQVLAFYSVVLVDRYAEMAGTGALLFYSLFVITEQPDMVITIPFVLYGLFRYWYIVESHGVGESPTDALLADRQLLLTVMIWAGLCMWLVGAGGTVR